MSESADLLAAELQKLRSAGVRNVDLVGKSMGGLVTRDVLTRPAYYDSDGRGGDRFPTVDRFIMIGTPNHGSSMAKLRCVAELGEHLSRLWTARRLDDARAGADAGDGAAAEDGGMGLRWFDFTCDGDGEAGLDLLPDSDFLRRLNARPAATHTRHTIIAGRLSPVSEQDVDAWLDRVEKYAQSQEAPRWLRRLLSNGEAAKVRERVDEAVRGLGDGLVTIDSARVEGVDDFVIVRGDHVGMLCNVLPSGEPPPAVPIVLDRLSRPVE